MRKLGQALGVDAMSLYHHVRDMDDIFDGIVDVVGEIDAPPGRHRLEDRLAPATPEGRRQQA